MDSGWNVPVSTISCSLRRGTASPSRSNRLGRDPYYLYVIRVQRRNELQAYLTDEGVGTGVSTILSPCICSPPTRSWSFRKGLSPISENVETEILSLPMLPQLHIDQQQQVVGKIKKFLLR